MLIANNNYRLLFKKICLVGNWKFVQKNFRDFVILANDGEIRTSKYLLYLSMEYFHELFTADSTLNSITLNFNREIIEKVRKSTISTFSLLVLIILIIIFFYYLLLLLIIYYLLLIIILSEILIFIKIIKFSLIILLLLLILINTIQFYSIFFLNDFQFCYFLQFFQLIDFTYKGIFSFTIDKMNELDSIVQCIKLLKPLKEHIVLECIVEMLTEYLMKVILQSFQQKNII